MAGEINADGTRVMYARMYARWSRPVLVLVILAVVLGLGVGAIAYPHLPGTTDTIGQPGMTALVLSVTAGAKMSVTVSRAITPRLDVALRVRPDDLFIPTLHAVLIDAFGLVSVGVVLAPSGVTLGAGLFLGPVRFDWARNWATARRWTCFTLAPHPGVSVTTGITWGNAPARFIGRITMFRNMRWIALSLTGTELCLTVGGLF